MRIVLTDAYERELTRIEDFIFSAADDVSVVEGFIALHDDALAFIAANPKTPAVHPATGDQSWIFGNGRYRVFFKIVGEGRKATLFMTHIIDNREANLSVYPGNSLPTYTIDE
jgi:hypothetical protein